MRNVHCLTKSIAAILFLAVAAQPAHAGECPLGPGETELSISRVMRNFGRGFMPAESVAQSGVQDPSSIADSQLRDAISGMEMAKSCAATTLADRNGSLLPSKADEYQGAERDAYIERFHEHMKDFVQALETLEKALKSELARPAAKRDFRKVADDVSDVKESATRAHGDL